MSRERSQAAVVPIAIGETNCEAAVGRPWRWVRELAAKHNVPRLPGKMPCFRADALMALFSVTQDSTGTPAQSATEEDVSVDSVLRAVGRRRGGAR